MHVAVVLIIGAVPRVHVYNVTGVPIIVYSSAMLREHVQSGWGP